MAMKNTLLVLTFLALVANQGCGRVRDDELSNASSSSGVAGEGGDRGKEDEGGRGGDGAAPFQSVAGRAGQAGQAGEGNGVGGAGGAIANTPNCLALAACCAAIPQAGHSTCSDAALRAPDDQCAYSLAMNETELLCMGPGESTVACLQTTGSATDCTLWITGAATKATRQDDCTTNGGTVVDECPAAGITGCCDYGGEERCSYDHSSTPQGCTQLGGTYSDTLIPLLPP